MKISNIYNIQQFNSQNKVRKNAQKMQYESNVTNLCSYPQNYYISFEGLSMKDFYDKHVQTGEIPTTLKNYYEDQQILASPQTFLILQSSSPKEIQKLAFEKLEDCYSVEDIKKAFPNEEAFKNLRTLEDIPRFGGRLFSAMKKYEQRGIKTFVAEEDITTFIVKKLYLEGKRYNVIFEEIKAYFGEEVKDELTEIISKYKPARDVFEPLGIAAPDGRTYLNDMQDGRTRINPANFFKSATPEEINERIKSLLEGAQKARYSMMDAWNHCIQAREDLSNFLSENLKNPELLNSELSIYEAKFYSKMSNIMTVFWAKYPQHKETLGKEIKEALERYNRVSEENLSEYIAQIAKTSNEIKKAIQEKRMNFRDNYPYALELLKKMSSLANPMVIKSKSANEDFFKLLSNEVNKDEFEILEGNKETKAYKTLVPNGIKEKMRALCAKPEFINISNAQKVAILAYLCANGDISSEKANELVLENALKGFANNQNIDSSLIDQDYGGFKLPLNENELEEIEAELLEFNSGFEKSKEKDFRAYIKTQGKYLKEGLNSEELSTLTKLIFWQGFDTVFGTSETQKIVNNMNLSNVLNNAIDILDELDFDF